MKFSVTLYSEPILSELVKYRIPILIGSIWTSDTVSIGNFTNKNVLTDNGIELSCPFSVASKANVIKLVFESITVVGIINSIEYVNDNNTRVSYEIDGLTSGLLSTLQGSIMTLLGHCERTNISYSGESFVNSLPEPVSGQDIKIVDTQLTGQANDVFNNFLGISEGSTLQAMGYKVVVFLSSFAAQSLSYAGVSIDEWQSEPALPMSSKVQVVPDFLSAFQENTVWHGGVSRGVPVTFNTVSSAGAWIAAILAMNIGQQVIMPPTGIPGSTSTGIERYANVSKGNWYTSPGSAFTTAGVMIPAPVVQTRIITAEDFFEVKIVPAKFCNIKETPSYGSDIAVTELTPGSFNPIKGESEEMSKAMTFPYMYYVLRTKCGNDINIIPQKNLKQSDFINQSEIHFDFKFVGGTNPKFLVSVKDHTADGTQDKQESGNDWVEVCSYPSISMFVGASSDQQLQDLSSKLQRQSFINQGVIEASQSMNSIEFGMRGGNSSNDTNNLVRRLGIAFGNALGSGSVGGPNNVFGLNTTIGDLASKALGSPLQAGLDKMTVAGNATRIVTGGSTITGEGQWDNLYSQPVTIYKGGFLPGDHYNLCRVFEFIGQSVSENISPITGGLTYFNGKATTTTYSGKTYFKFSHMYAVGNCPEIFKSRAINFFLRGGWLVI